MMFKYSIFQSLFWRISLIFVSILIIFAAISFLILTQFSEMYFKETFQKLNRNVAEHISTDNDCFINGQPNKAALDKVFHDVMIINPSIEVYLLNKDGGILTYFAPDKVINLKTVPLGPIKKFIAHKGKNLISGIDPKNPGIKKPFSAAKVYEGDKFLGYIYIILNSEEYENVIQMIKNSYYINEAFMLFIIALIISVFAGAISLLLLSRQINKINLVINDFKKGNMNARITFKTKGELKKFSDTFNEMADTILDNFTKIKEIDRSRRELVANISHDLRHPLSIILGFVDTLILKSDSITPDKRIEYLKIIKRSIERLTRLVEELFELSKLEAQQKKPVLVDFSITDLVSDVIQKNKINAAMKSIELELVKNADYNIVNADVEMIERVIQNLVSNAIKYSFNNSKVLVSLIQINKKIVVKIKDYGPGIKDDTVDLIYDEDNTVKRIKSDSKKSSGLGLLIVNKILKLHDTKITFSTDETGTESSFELPLSY